MESRLDYEHHDHHVSIVWCDEVDGVGATVGECWREHEEGQAPDREKNEDSWDCWAAEHAAASFADEMNSDGFAFYSMTTARKAMAAIKAALKAKRPLFDWEQKALAAGWKRPKG